VPGESTEREGELVSVQWRTLSVNTGVGMRAACQLPVGFSGCFFALLVLDRLVSSFVRDLCPSDI
jgi:hypothetical protein